MSKIFVKFIALVCFFILPCASHAATLFSESFDDANFSSRDWYDVDTFAITSSDCHFGSCAQFSFNQGATTPTGTPGTARKLFTAADSLYISFYVKFATGWRGSQQSYHPHLIYVLSDADDEWAGPANSYLDTYIEFLSDIGSPYAIRPMLALQDAKKVNILNGRPPIDLSAITENRSVNGCNTPASSGAVPDCFCFNDAAPTSNNCMGSEDIWYSAAMWYTNSSLSTNAWHHVETYFEMNTISGGIGQHDGVMREWIDGVQVINRSDVLYRTNQYPTQKWAQFIIGPYIGDGAPIAETFYMDSLTVGDTNPYEMSDITPPANPSGLSVL